MLVRCLITLKHSELRTRARSRTLDVDANTLGNVHFWLYVWLCWSDVWLHLSTASSRLERGAERLMLVPSWLLISFRSYQRCQLHRQCTFLVIRVGMLVRCLITLKHSKLQTTTTANEARTYDKFGRLKNFIMIPLGANRGRQTATRPTYIFVCCKHGAVDAPAALLMRYLSFCRR